MVLYRKYRPQKLSELDSSAVRESLTRIFSSSFMPHAFLFSGSRGTGKTSAARIIAKILNCEEATGNREQVTNNKKKEEKDKKAVSQTDGKTDVSIEPCNKCSACLSITEGSNLDVFEIDAASNRGIEEIRDLREKIRLAPVSGKYKVYIIDEVHMLTNEAFNALLKTLEEPPQHAVFILATTEPEKLPLTIISRCIRINFQKASSEEISNCLSRVISGEKLELTEEALRLIAASADGSFRDATKILEQAVAENALTEEKLKVLLGKQNISPEKFLQLIGKKDTKVLLEEIIKMGQSGANFRLFTEDILHLLHDLLVAQFGIDKNKVSAEMVDKFSKNDLSFLIKLFSRVYLELRGASIPQLPLELAIVEWCEK